jgi:hypothetical protein
MYPDTGRSTGGVPIGTGGTTSEMSKAKVKVKVNNQIHPRTVRHYNFGLDLVLRVGKKNG